MIKVPKNQLKSGSYRKDDLGAILTIAVNQISDVTDYLIELDKRIGSLIRENHEMSVEDNLNKTKQQQLFAQDISQMNTEILNLKQQLSNLTQKIK